ncbi:ubiquinol oxidase subunit II [Vibrio salinus]|uniref:ubiquinol oxidase subunit II n=1 Tax=Vibrio salinus TaxID=2899784 RepID=UPI001E38725C|nr:ubiquinol oxidase subunit II [Vibrio salinus]MCE0495137.1 ubiquinol oxidase subunit II [Vibrio salinus]
MKASRYKNLISRACLLFTVLMLSGCKFALLDPKGQVGLEIRELIITAVFLMLIVVVPVILMVFYFSHKYRATNSESQKEYAPDWAHSTKIEVVVWAVPVIIIAILAVITWRSSHYLEPSTPLKSEEKTMTIEVVALNWKWLFIYPDQKIATVNEVAFPKDVPVLFKLTSDDVMNSFFIPRLGSQLYAMPAMVTRLHLVANEAGDYRGIAASYSGEGFSHMKFTAIALPSKDSFEKWVDKVKSSDKTINDFNDYRTLAKPSIDAPVAYFSKVPDNLFNEVVMQYPGGMNHSGEDAGEMSHGQMHMHHEANQNEGEMGHHEG